MIFTALRGWALALVASLLVPTHATAQLAGTIVQVKPSIVAVGTFQRTRSPAFQFLATGFVVGAGDRIATNAHALPAVLDLEQREQLAVALPSGDGRGEIRLARRHAEDSEHDLAILSVDGPRLPPLWAVLVNPLVEMPTGPIFRAFDKRYPSPPSPHPTASRSPHGCAPRRSSATPPRASC